eukprot:gene6303-983_t
MLCPKALFRAGEGNPLQMHRRTALFGVAGGIDAPAQHALWSRALIGAGERIDRKATDRNGVGAGRRPSVRRGGDQIVLRQRPPNSAETPRLTDVQLWREAAAGA